MGPVLIATVVGFASLLSIDGKFATEPDPRLAVHHEYLSVWHEEQGYSNPNLGNALVSVPKQSSGQSSRQPQYRRIPRSQGQSFGGGAAEYQGQGFGGGAVQSAKPVIPTRQIVRAIDRLHQQNPEMRRAPAGNRTDLAAHCPEGVLTELISRDGKTRKYLCRKKSL